MESLMMGLLAETSIHPGVGRNLGVIDLPVAREAATDYPVLVGSSLKGALRDIAGERLNNKDLCNRLFGQQVEAGQILVSDARLLLLPVRSLTGQYRWVTCPHILERLARDKRRARLPTGLSGISVDTGKALGHAQGSTLFLEEREFVISDAVPEGVTTELQVLIGNAECSARVAEQLAILTNDDFSWFARYGLPVQARNVLDEKKTSKNLWYEETLPPDTLMYALIAERNKGGLKQFRTIFKDRPYLQAGGNETIGQGVFLVALSADKNKAEGED